MQFGLWHGFRYFSAGLGQEAACKYKHIPRCSLGLLAPGALEQVKKRTADVLVLDSVKQVTKGGAVFGRAHSKYPED